MGEEMQIEPAEQVERTFRSGRRQFLAAGATIGSMPFIEKALGGPPVPGNQDPSKSAVPSLIGDYGNWAAHLIPDPPELSFRKDRWPSIEAWREVARKKTLELMAAPEIEWAPTAETIAQYTEDGLDIEEIQWQLPYGRPTQAVVLKPQGASGPLPAVLGLHDHGGNKYFGRRKIVRTERLSHPLMIAHQRRYYAGRAWANEIARRGFVVLVHDAFAFASRRVMFQDMAEIPWGDSSTQGMSDIDPENEENIEIYNRWAAAHESVMAKSLFCAGTTWPGVYFSEDRAALDVLTARDDVDAQRVGCAGLSGGGLRTVYLGGLDPRIRCAICVGFMTTWNDFLLNKAYTHTWMTYTPLLRRYLDFPEILGLRAPLPTMVQSCIDDPLYTMPEMEAADRILQDVFDRAGAADHYQCRFYPGEHKFDLPMQQHAFQWFDRWLRS